MLYTLVLCFVAFLIICAAWLIHPGLGILVALLSYGAINGLLARE
jgi:hypothetical protein